MNISCSAVPCPVILNSTCVFYEAGVLLYTGINSGDNLQTALQKIDAKFQDAGLGYIFQNGVIQSVPGDPVKLGGSLTENTLITNSGFTFRFTETIEAQSFITTGGTSSQFVKGDGSLDGTTYQTAGNYITALTGDGTASGPGTATFTLTNTSVIPNTYGNASQVPVITVDGKGRVTNVSNTPINYPNQLILISGDVTGAGNTNSNTTLTLNTVNSGVFNSITPLKFSVNAKGLVTGASALTNLDIFSLIGYTPVPQTRTLSINGVTYDLSANRSWTLPTGGTVSSVSVTAGTGISASVTNPTTTPNITITNTAPDQVVVLNSGTGISTSGTYPNFTITNTSPSLGGTVTSVGLSMPSAFTVTNSPVTSSGTLTVTGAGNASQYVRGDGQLATLPSSPSGGGASISYYLNGSIPSSVVGYQQLSKIPILGTGTNFTTGVDGLIAQFLTDAGDPGLLNIPGGNWLIDMYFSANSAGGTPSFYVELYKYDGAIFTLLASNVSSPEGITNGTAIDFYTTSLAVPTTTLSITDRLAIKVYVNVSGKILTLHTENNNLCEIVTTFSTGVSAINGLTAQVQFLATGTSGTDFNINSATNTHTFHLPVASATNTGKLSSTDWSNFNTAYTNRITSLTTTGSSGAATLIANILNIPNYTLSGLGGVPLTRTLTINGTALDLSADRSWSVGTVTSVAALTLGTSGTDLSSSVATGTTTPVITLNVPTASATNRGVLSSPDWTMFNNKQNALTNPITGTGTGTSLGGTVAYFTGTTTQAGSSNLWWDNTNGRLGILNNAPNSAFQIGSNISGTAQTKLISVNDITTTDYSNAAFFNSNIATTRLGFVLSNSSSTNWANNHLAILVTGASHPNNNYFTNISGKGNDAGYGMIIGQGSQTTGLLIGTYGSNPVYLGTNNNARLSIFSNGNIAIGTTTDAGYKLDVNGTAIFRGNTLISSAYSTPNTTSGNLRILTTNAQTTNVGGSLGLGGNGANPNLTFALLQSGSETGFGDRGYFSLYTNGTGISSPFVERLRVTSNGTLSLNHLKDNTASTVPLAVYGSASQSANLTSWFNSGNSLLAYVAANGLFGTSSSITASSAIARGVFFNNTLVAAANNDVLVGLDINPTFTNGAFTGLQNYGLRLQGQGNDILRINTGISTTSSSSITVAENWGPSFNGIYLAYYNNSYTTSGFRRANAGVISTTGSGGLNIVSDASGASIRFHNKSGININQQISEFFATGNLLLQTGGTFTDAGFKLDVNGTARVQSSIAWGSSLHGRLTFAGNDAYIDAAISTGNLIFRTNGSTEAARFTSTQNVLIGTTTDIASSKLTVTSTTQGFLPPRMTTAQRDLIATPAAGLIIYNTSTSKHQGYNGTTWNDFY